MDDPVDGGTVLSSAAPPAAGGKYGAADLVTKKAYRGFRLHIEFLLVQEGGNSGVYLQNRYEIQVLDGRPVDSFPTLLCDLGTIARNRLCSAQSESATFNLLTQPTPDHSKAFEIHGVRLPA